MTVISFLTQMLGNRLSQCPPVLLLYDKPQATSNLALFVVNFLMMYPLPVRPQERAYNYKLHFAVGKAR